MKTLMLAAARCSLMFTAVVGFSLACPAKANLITNGGFETGDLTGWTPSSSRLSVTGVEDFAPHSGNYQARSFGGTLGQTLATIPGDRYFVSFWWASFTFPGDSPFLEVTWGGDVEILLDTGDPFTPYTHFTFSVPATSASTELQFALFSDTSWLDDVSVSRIRVGVPDAGSTVSLLGFALLGLATLRRKLPLPAPESPVSFSSASSYVTRTKYSIFLLSIGLILSAFAPQVRATDIIVGLGNSNNGFPFIPVYSGEYQQIYSSSAFGQPFQICAIAFQTVAPTNAQQGSFDFTLSFGTTSRTPGNPGSSYSGTFTPVFSGTRTVNFTNAGNFDLTIPLSTPFLYDPALGNLLMDVVINSATETGGFGFFAFGDGDPQVGRVYNSNGTGAATAGPNEGLLTRFTSCATSVPDSATTVLLFGFGLSGIVGVRKTLQSRRA